MSPAARSIPEEQTRTKKFKKPLDTHAARNERIKMVQDLRGDTG